MSKNHLAAEKPAASSTATSPCWDSQLHEPRTGEAGRSSAASRRREALVLGEDGAPDAASPPGRVDDAVEPVLAMAVGRVDDLALGRGDHAAVDLDDRDVTGRIERRARVAVLRGDLLDAGAPLEAVGRRLRVLEARDLDEVGLARVGAKLDPRRRRWSGVTMIAIIRPA